MPLIVRDLSNNQLLGAVPNTLSSLKFPEDLKLFNNRFTSFPDSINVKKCTVFDD